MSEKELSTDVLIVGGGMGGVAAAWSAADAGCSVIMTEETNWLGGQMTSQFVPPDEHRWIESFGRTRRYAELRHRIREYYRKNFRLTGAALNDSHLNPGCSTVSKISHLPTVSVEVINSLLMPFIVAGKIKIYRRTVATAADRDGMEVRGVSFRNLEDDRTMYVRASYVLDATELGDLLPLAKVDYVSGAESRAETGEPHAIDGPAEPENVQAITWCMPIAYDPECTESCKAYAMPRPKDYDFWKEYTPSIVFPWPGKLIDWTYWVGWKATGHLFRKAKDRTERDLWTYRRIYSNEILEGNTKEHEVSVINWWHNDFYEGNIIDKSPVEKERLLEQAGQLSLSLAYWLQNEAPRPDGKKGYPGLYLRPDLTGREDGLAPYPYIRESRRIKALFTVTENHIGVLARGGRPPELFRDSCGIGSYGMDIHPTNFETQIRPDGWAETFNFQIPLGALISQNTSNLLAACKNIGTTHLTNGCYRLHPVEWNIGESAGALAAFCLKRKCRPSDVYESNELCEAFQSLLQQQGVELAWPEVNASREHEFNTNAASH